MRKEGKDKKMASVPLCTLPFGKYNDSFEHLNIGEKKTLKDTKSDKNSYMPVKVVDEQVFLTKPDGKLIPNIQGQRKCDFLIYCQSKSQSCFIELKGENISIKEGYNPYNQISDTVDYLKKEEQLKGLVDHRVEKHAFIVSPGRQKLPKGIESKERFLWQKLIQKGENKKKIEDLIHYVKVTKSDRYSNNGQIICSTRSPIEIPFGNRE